MFSPVSFCSFPFFPLPWTLPFCIQNASGHRQGFSEETYQASAHAVCASLSSGGVSPIVGFFTHLTELDLTHWGAEPAKTSCICKSLLGWRWLNPGQGIQESQGTVGGGTWKVIFELHTCLWQRCQEAPHGASAEAERIMWKPCELRQEGGAVDPETQGLDSQHPFPHWLGILGPQASFWPLHNSFSSVKQGKGHTYHKMSLKGLAKISQRRKASPAKVCRSQFSAACLTGTWGWCKILGRIKSNKGTQYSDSLLLWV